MLSILYSKWSLACEAQILSRTLEDQPSVSNAEVLKYTGRGQAPKFKWARLAGFEGAAHVARFVGCADGAEGRGEDDSGKAALVKRAVANVH